MLYEFLIAQDDMDICNIPSYYKEYEWLQFTGLKDKNKKKIYEGDIVKYQGVVGFDYDDKDEEIEEVKYVNGAFEPIYFSQRDLHTYEDRMIVVEDIEVIGNIYENPDIIKLNKEEK